MDENKESKRNETVYGIFIGAVTGIIPAICNEAFALSRFALSLLTDHRLKDNEKIAEKAINELSRKSKNTTPLLVGGFIAGGMTGYILKERERRITSAPETKVSNVEKAENLISAGDADIKR